MTAKKWVVPPDPDRWLTILEDKGWHCTERRTTLFKVGCCRRVWRVFTDPRSRNAIDMAELFADGLITRREMDLSLQAARAAIEGDFDNERAAKTVACCVGNNEFSLACVARLCRYATAPNPNDHDQALAEAEQQELLIHEIFPNPFRPFVIDETCRTSIATALARQMYESRDFGAMPILADALQDAGCDNEDILKHCRDANGIHVRGCWVVDLILGLS